MREPSSAVPDALDSRMEQRWALAPNETEPGQAEPGRVAVWTRMPELLEPSAASLAVLGDYVPMGISVAQGRATSSTSLDNTLRVVEVLASEWYLLDIQIDGIRNGFGHGAIHIWTDDGRLTAIGNQSCIVRPRRTPAAGSSR